MKYYGCPQCFADVEVGKDDTAATCPECKTQFVVDRDYDWEPEYGWRDLTSLSLPSEPLTPEEIRLNNMDQEVSDFMEEGR